MHYRWNSNNNNDDYAAVQSMLRARIDTMIQLHGELGRDTDILDTEVAEEFEMGSRDIPGFGSALG